MSVKGVSVRDVKHQGIRDLIATRNLSAAGLVIGSGDATKLKTTNTITYCIDGVVYTKATTSPWHNPKMHPATQ